VAAVQCVELQNKSFDWLVGLVFLLGSRLPCNKCRAKVRWNFWWPIWLTQDIRMTELFNIIRSNRWKNNFLVHFPFVAVVVLTKRYLSFQSHYCCHLPQCLHQIHFHCHIRLPYQSQSPKLDPVQHVFYSSKFTLLWQENVLLTEIQFSISSPLT
jgi:hypothetical protein